MQVTIAAACALAAWLGIAGTAAAAPCPVPSTSVYGQRVADTPGVISYWRLGESSGTVACDAIGSAQGTYVGGFTLGAPGAPIGDASTAVALDGSSGRVSVASSAALNPSAAYSLEAWVNPASASTGQTVMRKDNQYLLRIDAGALRFRGYRSDGTYVDLASPAVVTAGTWQHVVATWSGAAMRIYRNGVQVAYGPAAGAPAAAASPLRLGSSSTYDYFGGRLDEVAVYSAALSATTVARHYDRTPPPAPTGLTATGGDRAVSLGWRAAPDNVRVTGYHMYRRTADGTWARIARVTGTGYTDTGLTNGTRYSYFVRAFDAAGNLSPMSVIASATAVAAPGPVFPAPASYAWYVAPNGSTSNSGRSASSPTTLAYARDHALPGESIGLLDGEYPIHADAWGHGFYFRAARSGTAGKPIRYRSVNPRGARFVWKDGTPGGSIFYVEPGTHDLSIENISLDGGSAPGSGVIGAALGIAVKDRSHHVRLIGNYIRYMSASGVLVQNSDYVLTYGNLIWQCGNNPPSATGSWGSAINYHHNFFNYDTAAGFHSAIVANIAGGEVDTSQYHSDGNGIILDNAGLPSGFVNSPILIAGNAIYMNGGRGIHDLKYNHAWIVNNSVYKNGLDTRVGAPTGAPQYMAYAASDVNYVNNAAVSWGTVPNFGLYEGATARFWRNTRYQGGSDRVPSTVSGDPNQLRTTDPAFTAPPTVAPIGDRQWLNAPDPRNLAGAFVPSAGSTLIDRGIDPRSIPALAGLLDAGTTPYITRDRSGASRPRRGGWDIGAHEAP